MECPCLVAPKDEELLRYALDGEALPAVAEDHLNDCDICQQRLTIYTEANSFLIGQLYRYQCPNLTRLGEFCLGLLTEYEHAQIELHLKLCPLCASDVDEARQFLMPQPNFLNQMLISPFYDPASDHIEVKYCQSAFTIGVKQERTVYVRPSYYQANTVSLSMQARPDDHDHENILLRLIFSSLPDTEEPLLLEGTRIELYNFQPVLAPEEEHSELAVCIERIPDYFNKPILSAQVDAEGCIILPSVPMGEYLMIVYLPELAMVIEKLTIARSYLE
ncbi:hypothetical protein KDA_26010 [Dictyobacter alpinus]|uniref:Zinc-finger domain-containing protein n=1 Tax=Dictyobacter alpinus TaxID=2014873 RepID=A0A402B717_9CHLR|nr:hypothetical protein [Dictyobacter alpinus]GCE27117.1 hypothetical protein KDA_26010 [Dictyobacter alpinus]